MVPRNACIQWLDLAACKLSSRHQRSLSRAINLSFDDCSFGNGSWKRRLELAA